MLKDVNFHALIAIGFEEKEARIYLSLLELGSASILAIAKASGVNRASIYYIIDKMKQKGIVSHVEKTGGDVYMPISPEILLAQGKKHLRDFEAIVPELHGMINRTGQRPRVRFYEGLEAVKKLYEDTLNARGEILNYANSQGVRDYWPEYDIEYVAQRVAAGLHLRGIAPDDETGRRVHADDRKCLRQIRLIDRKKLNFTNEINIYNNKISMISFGQQIFGVIIESQAMADTQRSIFEMAWQFASPAKKH